MPKRNLLICFDAFGTLFRPRQPIAQQYGEVARSLGLSGFTDDDVRKSFGAAYKHESKQNPNYGKATSLGAEKWWTNVINGTFKPFLLSSQHLPAELAPKLLHRFWSNEGYELFPDVLPLLQQLRRHTESSGSRVVVGVITNSDDRVPSILTSLGLRVSPLRYGDARIDQALIGKFDVDFTAISYDVGHEKPDKRIFMAAEETLGRIFDDSSRSTESLPAASDWRKVYVGDDFANDIVGAVEAGWYAVLIDREFEAKGRSDITWLDEQTPGNLFDVFDQSKAVAFSSMAKFAEWFPVRGP